MTANGAPAVLVNGTPVDCVSGMDRGLLYGDGVFETLRVEQGAPVFWRRHMTRLLAGCSRLAIAGVDADTLYDEAGLLLGGKDRCVLKVIVTRGTGGRGYGAAGSGPPTRILQRHPTPGYPEKYRRDGVRVRMCQTRLSHDSRLAGIKHLNRLEQVLARSEWNDPETQEGLVLDSNGRLVEGTMSNVFMMLNGSLVTPDLSCCGVAGIMRSIVAELAGQSGQRVQRVAVTPEELTLAEEVFLTNSLIGIWPVRRIDSRDYCVGPVTRRLQAALAGLVDEGAGWLSDDTRDDMND